MIVFSTRAVGQRIADRADDRDARRPRPSRGRPGPAACRRAARSAPRRPSRAGQAVAFAADARPSASPASTSLAPPQQGEAEAQQGQDRHVGAADGELERDHRRRRDEHGPAHACSGRRPRAARARRRPGTRAPNQTRGSVITWPSRTAPAGCRTAPSPADRGCRRWGCAPWPARQRSDTASGRVTSCLADRAMTATSGCFCPSAAFRNSGATSAPATLSSSARSMPRDRQSQHRRRGREVGAGRDQAPEPVQVIRAEKRHAARRRPAHAAKAAAPSIAEPCTGGSHRARCPRAPQRTSRQRYLQREHRL